MNALANSKFDVKTMTRIALCTALIAVCSWISVPAHVPFTLQTFAVFFACDLLGAAAVPTVALYLLLGAVGVPVFAEFSGGLGSLLGATGGYLIGFLAIAVLMTLWQRLFRERFRLLGMLLGLMVCYLFGTCWFVVVYARGGSAISFMTALGWCVLPYIIPDLIKILLARLIAGRVREALKGSRA